MNELQSKLWELADTELQRIGGHNIIRRLPERKIEGLVCVQNACLCRLQFVIVRLIKVSRACQSIWSWLADAWLFTEARYVLWSLGRDSIATSNSDRTVKNHIDKTKSCSTWILFRCKLNPPYLSNQTHVFSSASKTFERWLWCRLIFADMP